MIKIKAKYEKGIWYLNINGVKSKIDSLVKGISNYIDTLDKPQEMRFTLFIKLQYLCGQGVFEIQTCYATSDFTLPFIEELEKQILSENIKLNSFKKISFPNPNLKEDVLIDNDLITRDYTLNFERKEIENSLETTKNIPLNKMITFFKESKILRKSKRIFFNSESYTMSVLDKKEKKPMYKGFMFFDSEQSEDFSEYFKKFLQLHEKVLNNIASSIEE